MKTKAISGLLALGFGLAISLPVGSAGAAEENAKDHLQVLRDLSTLPDNQIESLNEYWEVAPNIGFFVIGDEIAGIAGEMQELYNADGAAGIAQRLRSSFGTEAATPDFAGAGLGILAEAGYGSKRSMLDKKLFKSKEEDAAKLEKMVGEITQALMADGSLEGRMAAAEFLLQVHSEGTVCLHNESGNGGRSGPVLPASVTAIAAPLLADADPFVSALADWTMSITVCNANDDDRGEAYPPKEGETPQWFTDYMNVSEEMHLPFDYVRQAVSLGMHRTPENLVKLATDVCRRAWERAEWVKTQGADAAAVDQAVNRMGQALEALKQAAAAGYNEALHNAYLAWRPTVREVVLQGPDLDFDSMVYIKRFNAKSHLQPGVHSASQFPDGGDIFVQQGFDPAAPEKGLVAEQLGNGFGHDLDMWWDADRIVFSWGKGNLQKLYEVNLDGSNLKQITEGPFDDVDPAYLPDGEVVFGSTRGEVGIMCHGASGLGSIGNDGSSGTFSGLHTNIYRTWDNFGRVERLTYCKDDDAYPHVLNDGRIVYMRWDYQERDVNEIFSLWVIHPDGTGADGFHKVHIPAHETIQALRDTRAIEGTSLMVSAGGGHYSYAEGIVVLGDPREGINNPDSLKNVTPYASPTPFGWGRQLEPVAEGGVPYLGGYYCKPWPLSEKSFLVSASYDQPQSNNFQGYYIDVWGNKELLQRDKLFETVCVTPIKARQRPPVLANKTNDQLTHATLYMDDVYADLPGVEKGAVKYVRILQMIHWVKEIGASGVQWHPKANAGECFAFGGTGGPVRTVGIVPVNEDGSAFFEVPSDADLYFQALDENFMAVRRMRTHVEFQPGEIRGCIGCHETKTDAVGGYRMGDALANMTPVRPTPPPWGDRTFLDFEEHIQPIFEAKCVECHSGKADQGWLDLTAKRDKWGFMQGYRALFGLKADDTTPLVEWTVTGTVGKEKLPRDHDHPWWNVMFEDIYVRGGTEGRVTEVNQFGAVKHPLAKKLVEDPEHKKLLTPQEMQMMMNFFDVQAPYFSTFRQQLRKDLIQVRVEPYESFGQSREHIIHHGQDVTPQL